MRNKKYFPYLLLIISLTSMFSFFSFFKKKHKRPMQPQQTYTYLALGDSYTIGEAVSVQERWPVQLANMLGKEGVQIKEPYIIAKTGWTTAELLENLQSVYPIKVGQKPYNLVSLLIGVNNQYRGQTIDQYRTELQKLLKIAVELAGNQPKHVFVLSIPDWGVTPFAAGRDSQKIAQEIDQFNQVALEETQKMNIPFIDITPLSREAKDNVSFVAQDKLHFSGSMYQKWAEKSLPIVKNCLLSN